MRYIKSSINRIVEALKWCDSNLSILQVVSHARPENAGNANGGADASPYRLLGGIFSMGSSLIKQAAANNPSLLNDLKQAGAGLAKNFVVETRRNLINAVTRAAGPTQPTQQPMQGNMASSGNGHESVGGHNNKVNKHSMAGQMNQMGTSPFGGPMNDMSN